MNRLRLQGLVFIPMTVSVVAACGNTTRVESDLYAIPAPPPVAPYSEDVNAVNAREKARTAAANGTVVARATDRALETRGTEVALLATSTAIAMLATLQASAVQATVQAQTFLVQATGIALSATGTERWKLTGWLTPIQTNAILHRQINALN